MTREKNPNGLIRIEIGATNRGLAYGDGLFESMRCIDREIPLWAHHKERLLASLKRLQIKLAEPLLEAELNQVIAQLPKTGTALVKFIVTRGDSPRGYRADPNAESWRLWQILEAPPCYSRAFSLGKCETRLADQPLLAGMKHLNRLEQVMARLEWQDEFQDALMCDYHDRVIETVMANIFVWQGDSVLTPSLDRCGVSGVMRSYLIDRVFPRFELSVREAELSFEDLREARGLWVCNSVRGLGEVSQCADISWPQSELFGQIRRHLNASLHPRWDR